MGSIFERRIKIGYHNTSYFSQEPSIISLQPIISPETGEIIHFSFDGDLEFKHHPSKDQFDAIVFIIEYRIKLNVSQAPQKKTVMLAIKENISSTLDLNQLKLQSVTRDFSLGWGVSFPVKDGFHSIKLMSGTAVNPLGNYGYIPPSNYSSNSALRLAPIEMSVSFTSQRLGKLIESHLFITLDLPKFPMKSKSSMNISRASMQSIPRLDSPTRSNSSSILSSPLKSNSVSNMNKRMTSTHNIERPPSPLQSKPVFSSPLKQVSVPLKATKSISTISLSEPQPKIEKIKYDKDRLYEAGFDVTQPYPSKSKTDPMKEMKDVLTVNQISIECMGVTFNEEFNQGTEMVLFNLF